jgi:hypothetical protein
MPTSRTRAIKLLTRQAFRRAAYIGIVLSPESQLKDLEDLVEDCRHRRATADDNDAAKLANVEVTAHKAIALIRLELTKSQPKSGDLTTLSDDELQERKLKLVAALTK